MTPVCKCQHPVPVVGAGNRSAHCEKCGYWYAPEYGSGKISKDEAIAISKTQLRKLSRRLADEIMEHSEFPKEEGKI